MNKYWVVALAIFTSFLALGQNGYWQQRVDYTMDIEMNAEEHQFHGKQTLVFENNSPDDLDRLFYHLYFNAFQPGSMMDVRSRTIKDPDDRVGSRIEGLSPEEIGYHKINSLTMNGVAQPYTIENTILEVQLTQPIKAGEKVTLVMDFDSQVPLQIRRSGRDSKEGIEFSMSQWYPKLAEYDKDGWHPNPYVGREFYGIWGDFKVNITMDESYVIGGTGILENESTQNGKKTWNFKAENVHDFVWAADPDYVHDVIDGPNGMKIHFYYEDKPAIANTWKAVQPAAVKAFELFNKYFGEYPYEKYSVIQGGDGGMEYPMATLITGERSIGSLTGTMLHEMGHTWYQMLLATDEAQYPWMDEGFTTFASTFVQAQMNDEPAFNPHKRSMQGVMYMANSDDQEPISTHADFYHTNRNYGLSSYSKGATFMWQLQNIVGEEAFWKGMLTYFDKWSFKHPHPRDFIKIMEDESGMVLDWYLENWVGTTNTIDYGVYNVEAKDNATLITLENAGEMPMPLEVMVTYKNGDTELFYIPITLMRKNKEAFTLEANKVTTLNDWPWTHPYYQFTIPTKKDKIKEVSIDPEWFITDKERSNNVFPPQPKQVKPSLIFKGN